MNVANYDRIKTQNRPYEERRLLLLAQECRGREVLDLGYAQLPNKYLKNFHVVGFDLSPPAPDVPYAETVVGNCMEIDRVFAGRQFDTVICGELIEHLEEPYRFLRAMKTVIKPGGRLLLSTPNPMGFPVGICELLQIEKFFYTTDHTYYFLPRWLKRMVINCGYSLVKTIPVGFWLPGGVIPWCPNSLSYQLLYVCTPK